MIERNQSLPDGAGDPALLTIVQDAKNPEEGIALLVMPAPDGTYVDIPLPIGKALLLLILVRAWEEDVDLPEPIRGWRRRSVVAAQHKALLHNPFAVLDTTVTRYISSTKQRIVKAFDARAFLPPARLTEGNRAMGIRIRPGALDANWHLGRPGPNDPPFPPRTRPSHPPRDPGSNPGEPRDSEP